MATVKKKTRESQYIEILAKCHNTTLAQCSVLGYRFASESRARGFHYELMSNGAQYLLFDAVEDTAVVIVAGTKQAAQIRFIAKSCGANDYRPNLKY